MATPSEAVSAWIESRISGARYDGYYVIDEGTIAQLCALVVEELAVRAESNAAMNVPAARELLTLYLLDEADERRGLIGSAVAIRLSPVNVASAVLATVTTILWVCSDAPLASGSGALTVACDLQAALSIVSLLSRRERLIVSLLAAGQEAPSTGPVLIGDLCDLAAAAALEPTEVGAIVAQLVTKGAVTWDGQAGTPLSLNKWF